MHIMNNYIALYPLITLYNALYIKALRKVLLKFLMLTKDACIWLKNTVKCQILKLLQFEIIFSILIYFKIIIIIIIF